MTPVSSSQKISDGITGATLRVIPDYSHLPPVENHKLLPS